MEALQGGGGGGGECGNWVSNQTFLNLPAHTRTYNSRGKQVAMILKQKAPPAMMLWPNP